MTNIRLLAAGLALFMSFSAASASDPEQTGSISVMPATEIEEDGKAATVVLPELSVTEYAPVQRPLPSLKPLPKWDPHVCIGC